MIISLPEFSTEELLSKVSYIQNFIDPELRLVLNPEWNSKNPEHRLTIRRCMEEKFTSHFSREQLAWLNDLNWLPEARNGYFSISHSTRMGGFSYSQFVHGFDIEEMRRISHEIIKRTSTAEEQKQALRLEFLWVAKEAGFKALSPGFSGQNRNSTLVITDLIIGSWQSHFENKVFSFSLTSEKKIASDLNKGFVFAEGEQLFAVYFK